MKPYRLMSPNELHQLQQELTTAFSQWTDRYAATLIPDNAGIYLEAHSKLSATIEFENMLLIQDQGKPRALLSSDYLTFIKQSIFNEEAACFDAIANAACIALFADIFGSQTLTITNNSTQQDTWFYPGSACVAFNIQSTMVYLHPEWVNTKLPLHTKNTKPLYPLDEAMMEHAMTFTIQLSPIRLPIEKLLNLHIGDVITSDHPLTKPLVLCCGQHQIAEATAGQINHHKSIQLARSV